MAQAFQVLLKEDPNGPNNFGENYRFKINEYHAKAVNNSITLSVAIPPASQYKFAKLFDTSIVIPGHECKPHPECRAVSEYYKITVSQMIKSLSPVSRIVLMGSSFKEHKFIKRNHKGQVTAIISNRDLKDSTRLNEGLIQATSDSANPDSAKFLSMKDNASFHFSKTWPQASFDILIGFDCFYDIDPLEIAEYMIKNNIKITYFTMHYCSELLGPYEQVPNLVYNTKWLKKGDKVIMQLGDGNMSYVHDFKKISKWWRNFSFQVNDKVFHYEIVQEKFGYCLFKGSIQSGVVSTLHCPRIYSSADHIAYTFDVEKLLHYDEISLIPTDRDKLQKAINFTLTRNDEKPNAVPVMEMIRSLSSKMVIGGNLIQENWELLNKGDAYIDRLIPFIMLYTALTKRNWGEMQQMIGNEMRTANARAKSFWARTLRGIEIGIRRLHDRFNRFLGYNGTLLEFIHSIMYVDKTADFNKINLFNRKIMTHKPQYSVLIRMYEDIYPEHYYFLFTKDVLNFSQEKGILNHSGLKLAELLTKFELKPRNVAVFGAEPGGMNLELAAKGCRSTAFVCKNTVLDFKLDHAIYSSDCRRVYYEAGKYPDFDENYDLLVSDLSADYSFKSATNLMIFNDMFSKWFDSRIPTLVLKARTVAFKILIDRKINVEVFKPETSSPLSREVYLVITRTFFKRLTYASLREKFVDATSKLYQTYLDFEYWFSTLDRDQFIVHQHNIVPNYTTRLITPRPFYEIYHASLFLKPARYPGKFLTREVFKDLLDLKKSKRVPIVLIKDHNELMQLDQSGLIGLAYSTYTYLRSDFPFCTWHPEFFSDFFINEKYYGTGLSNVISFESEGVVLYGLDIRPSLVKKSQPKLEVKVVPKPKPKQTNNEPKVQSNSEPKVDKVDNILKDLEEISAPKPTGLDSKDSSTKLDNDPEEEPLPSMNTRVMNRHSDPGYSGVLAPTRVGREIVNEVPSTEIDKTENSIALSASALRQTDSPSPEDYAESLRKNMEGIESMINQKIEGRLSIVRSINELGCIVNAANNKLSNGGGFAGFLATKFPDFDNQCKQYKGQAQYSQFSAHGHEFLNVVGNYINLPQDFILYDSILLGAFKVMEKMNSKIFYIPVISSSIFLIDGRMRIGIFNAFIQNVKLFLSNNPNKQVRIMLPTNPMDAQLLADMVSNHSNYDFDGSKLIIKDSEKTIEWTMPEGEHQRLVTSLAAIVPRIEATPISMHDEAEVKVETIAENAKVWPEKEEEEVEENHDSEPDEPEETEDEVGPRRTEFNLTLNSNCSVHNKAPGDLLYNLYITDLALYEQFDKEFPSEATSFIEGYSSWATLTKGEYILQMYSLFPKSTVAPALNVFVYGTNNFKDLLCYEILNSKPLLNRVFLIIDSISETVYQVATTTGRKKVDHSEVVESTLRSKFPDCNVVNPREGGCFWSCLAVVRNVMIRDKNLIKRTMFNGAYKPKKFDKVNSDDIAKICSHIGVPYFHIKDVDFWDKKKNCIVYDEFHCYAILSHPTKWLGIPEHFNPLQLRESTIRLVDSQATFKACYNTMSTVISSFSQAMGSNEITGKTGKHQQALNTLIKFRNSTTTNVEAKIRLINGTAGAGKTHAIIKEMPAGTLIVVPSNENRLKLKESIKMVRGNPDKVFHVRTFIDALTDQDTKVMGGYKLPNNAMKYIVVDEAYRYSRAWFVFLVMLYPNASFILVGDHNQMTSDPSKSSDLEDQISMSQILKDKHISIKLVNSYRFGPMTVQMLKSIATLQNYGDVPNMKVMKDKPFSMYVVSSEKEAREIYPEATVICASSARYETSNSMPPNVDNIINIAKVQGNTYKYTCILVDQPFVDCHSFPSSLFVVLTRHDMGIIWLNPFGLIEKTPWLKALVDRFMGRRIDGKYPINYATDHIKNIGFDPLIFKETALETLKFVPESKTYKQFEAVKIDKNFTKVPFDVNIPKYIIGEDGPIFGDQEAMSFVSTGEYPMIADLQKRKPLVKEITRSPGVLSCKMDYASSGPKTIFTFMQRLFDSTEIRKKQKQAMLGMNKHQMNQINAKRFKNFYFKNPGIEQQFWGEECIDAEIIAVLNEFSIAVKSNAGDTKKTNIGVKTALEGFLKTQAKTKDSGACLDNKTGQPVAANSKAVNMIFSCFFRFAINMVKHCISDKWIIANNLSEEELSKKIQEALSDPDLFFKVEGDSPNFDATQSEFTSAEIDEILELVSIKGEYLRQYCSMTQFVPIFSIFFSSIWNAQLPSGSPRTMTGNILMSMNIIQKIYYNERHRIYLGVFKGDDSSLFVLGEYLNADFKEYWKFFTKPFKVKCFKGPTEFCGFLYGCGHYMYDPIKFVRKYMINKDYTQIIRTRENFKEFSLAIRLLTNPIRRNREACYRIASNRYDIPYEAAIVLVDQIDAFAALSLSEFKKRMNLVQTIVEDLPRLIGNAYYTNTPDRTISSKISDSKMQKQTLNPYTMKLLNLKDTMNALELAKVSQDKLDNSFDKTFEIHPEPESISELLEKISACNVTMTKVATWKLFVNGPEGAEFKRKYDVLIFYGIETIGISSSVGSLTPRAFGTMCYEDYMFVMNDVRQKVPNKDTKAIWKCCSCGAFNHKTSVCQVCGINVSNHVANAFVTNNSGTVILQFGKEKPKVQNKPKCKTEVKLVKPIMKTPRHIKLPKEMPPARKAVEKALKRNKPMPKIVALRPKESSLEFRNMKEVEYLASQQTMVQIGKIHNAIRLPTDFNQVPTAVAATYVEMQLPMPVPENNNYPANTNQGFAFVSRDPYVSCGYLDPNNAGQTYVYNAVNPDASGEEDQTSSYSTSWSMGLVTETLVNVPVLGFVAASQYAPHGAMTHPMGKCSAFFYGPNSTLTMNLNFDNANLPVIVIKAHGPSDKDENGIAVYQIQTQVPNADVVVFSPSNVQIVPGYYSIWISYEANSVVTINKIQISANSWTIAHLSMPKLINVLSAMDDVRTTFSCGMLSNKGAEAYASGSMIAYQNRGAESPLDYINQDIVGSISLKKGSSGALAFKDGITVPIKHNDISELNWEKTLKVNESFGVQAITAKFPWQANFVAFAYETPQIESTLTPPAIMFRVWQDIEFLTESQYYQLALPTVLPENFSKALSVVGRMSSYYTNVFHISEMWNSLKSAASKVAKGVIQYGPKVLEVAKLLG